MSAENALRYAQVYRFLADAFCYPQEYWLSDASLLARILEEMKLEAPDFGDLEWGLSDLQMEHRRVFGLTGSLCYETEYGLPHEFRQSQELADIAGFYRAFGFNVGGRLRERPDHLVVELEFMYLLCLKGAHSGLQGYLEQAEICLDAQRKFLSDHLGRWIGVFAQAVEKSSALVPAVSGEEKGRSLAAGPYATLASFSARFVTAHADALGATPSLLTLEKVQPTPLGPEMSCGDCPVQGANHL